MSTPADQVLPSAADTAMSTAMAQATDPSYNEQECADVKVWLKRIKDARDFDEGARKQYVIDRRYARGDAGQFEVNIPIASTYVDILTSFLYARDPDLDILPSDSTNPPPMADIMEQARMRVEADPKAQAMMQQVGVLARTQAVAAEAQASTMAPQGVLGLLPKATQPPPIDPNVVGQQAAQAWVEQTVRQAAKQILAPYKKRQEDSKQLGKTLEIVIQRLWKRARLKAQADPAVRSTLTVGAGWLKASWQERMGRDPIIETQLNDLQDNLAKLKETQVEIADGGNNTDALKAQYQQQIEGLNAKVEVIVARGLAIDYVDAEDVQVAPGGTLAAYRDAPWIAHRTFMPKADAKAAYPDLGDKIDKAAVYYQDKPQDPTEVRDVGILASVSADDADKYKTGANMRSAGKGDGNVLIWELWNKDTDMVLTLMEGLDCYARPPFAPSPGTTRFYPFFQISMLRVDGERHPQSMISRTQALLDDLNRLYSNRAEHRRRSIPKIGFDATQYDEREIKKLEAGGRGEMIPLKGNRPGEPIKDALAPIAYAVIDQALYDDRPTRAMLEMAWGIQEALAASVRTAKTATEAEIQQTGTNARTSYMRDSIDSMMDDLALYTAEVALQKMKHDDAVQIAGPWAFWPEGITIDDLSILLTVAVKGGSSGKPDTTAQQQAWATTMPILQKAAMLVGQLRQSAPSDIADCVEELVSETLSRSGDRLDVSRFMPPVPSEQPGPMPIAPGAAPGGPPQMGAPMGAMGPGAEMPPPNMPPTQGGANLVPVPHNGNINGHHPYAN